MRIWNRTIEGIKMKYRSATDNRGDVLSVVLRRLKDEGVSFVVMKNDEGEIERAATDKETIRQLKQVLDRHVSILNRDDKMKANVPGTADVSAEPDATTIHAFPKAPSSVGQKRKKFQPSILSAFGKNEDGDENGDEKLPAKATNAGAFDVLDLVDTDSDEDSFPSKKKMHHMSRTNNRKKHPMEHGESSDESYDDNDKEE